MAADWFVSCTSLSTFCVVLFSFLSTSSRLSHCLPSLSFGCLFALLLISLSPLPVSLYKALSVSCAPSSSILIGHALWVSSFSLNQRLVCVFVCASVCSADQRKYFQQNVLKFFTEKRTEAGHVEPTAEPGVSRSPAAEPRLETPAKQTIYWMFDELDQQPADRELAPNEVHTLFSELSREVGPRACADDMWRYCDYSDDGHISLSEWCWCTGQDPGQLYTAAVYPALL